MPSPSTVLCDRLNQMKKNNKQYGYTPALVDKKFEGVFQASSAI